MSDERKSLKTDHPSGSKAMPKTFGKKDGSPQISKANPNVQDFVSQGGSPPGSGTASPMHVPQMPSSVPANPDHVRQRFDGMLGPNYQATSRTSPGQLDSYLTQPGLHSDEGQTAREIGKSLPQNITDKAGYEPETFYQGQEGYRDYDQMPGELDISQPPSSQSDYVPLDQRWKKDNPMTCLSTHSPQDQRADNSRSLKPSAGKSMPTHIPKQSAMYQNQPNFYAQNQDLPYWQNQGLNVYFAPYPENQGYIIPHQAQMYLPHQLVQSVPCSLDVSQIANVQGQGQTVQFNQDQHLQGQSQQAFLQYPLVQGQIGQQRQLMNQPGQHLVKIAAVQNISQQSQNYQQRLNPVPQSGQVQTGYSGPIDACGSQNVTWQPVIQQNMQNSWQPKQQNFSHTQYSSTGSSVYPGFSAYSSSLIQQQNLPVLLNSGQQEPFQGRGRHFLQPPLQQGQYAMQPGYFSPADSAPTTSSCHQNLPGQHYRGQQMSMATLTKVPFTQAQFLVTQPHTVLSQSHLLHSQLLGQHSSAHGKQMPIYSGIPVNRQFTQNLIAQGMSSQNQQICHTSVSQMSKSYSQAQFSSSPHQQVYTQQQPVPFRQQQVGQQGHINSLSQYDQGTSQNGQPVSLPQEQQHLQQGLALQPQVFKPPTPSSLSSQQPQQNFSSSTHGQDQIFKSALQQQPVTQAYQGENRFSENYQEEQQRPKSPIISSFPQPDISKNQATADCYPVEEIDVKEQEKILDQIISEDSVKTRGTAARQSPPKVAPMPPRPNDNEYTSSVAGEKPEVVEKDKGDVLRDGEDSVNASKFSPKDEPESYEISQIVPSGAAEKSGGGYPSQHDQEETLKPVVHQDTPDQQRYDGYESSRQPDPYLTHQPRLPILLQIQMYLPVYPGLILAQKFLFCLSINSGGQPEPFQGQNFRQPPLQQGEDYPLAGIKDWDPDENLLNPSSTPPTRTSSDASLLSTVTLRGINWYATGIWSPTTAISDWNLSGEQPANMAGWDEQDEQPDINEQDEQHNVDELALLLYDINVFIQEDNK